MRLVELATRAGRCVKALLLGGLEIYLSLLAIHVHLLQRNLLRRVRSERLPRLGLRLTWRAYNKPFAHKGEAGGHQWKVVSKLGERVLGLDSSLVKQVAFAGGHAKRGNGELFALSRDLHNEVVLGQDYLAPLVEYGARVANADGLARHARVHAHVVAAEALRRAVRVERERTDLAKALVLLAPYVTAVAVVNKVFVHELELFAFLSYAPHKLLAVEARTVKSAALLHWGPFRNQVRLVHALVIQNQRVLADALDYGLPLLVRRNKGLSLVIGLEVLQLVEETQVLSFNLILHALRLLLV